MHPSLHECNGPKMNGPLLPYLQSGSESGCRAVDDISAPQASGPSLVQSWSCLVNNLFANSILISYLVSRRIVCLSAGCLIDARHYWTRPLFPLLPIMIRPLLALVVPLPPGTTLKNPVVGHPAARHRKTTDIKSTALNTAAINLVGRRCC